MIFSILLKMSSLKGCLLKTFGFCPLNLIEVQRHLQKADCLHIGHIFFGVKTFFGEIVSLYPSW